MRVTYIPPSPKAGQTEHVRNDVGRTLVSAGFAREEKYRDYREMLANEAPTASGHGSVDPNVSGTEWGVKDKSESSFSQVVIIKRTGSATTYYSTPPTDCPSAIVAQWQALKPNEDAEVIAEQVLQQKYRQATAQSEQKQADKAGVLSTLLFGTK